MRLYASPIEYKGFFHTRFALKAVKYSDERLTGIILARRLVHSSVEDSSKPGSLISLVYRLRAPSTSRVSGFARVKCMFIPDTTFAAGAVSESFTVFFRVLLSSFALRTIRSTKFLLLPKPSLTANPLLLSEGMANRDDEASAVEALTNLPHISPNLRIQGVSSIPAPRNV